MVPHGRSTYIQKANIMLYGVAIILITSPNNGIIFSFKRTMSKQELKILTKETLLTNSKINKQVALIYHFGPTGLYLHTPKCLACSQNQQATMHWELNRLINDGDLTFLNCNTRLMLCTALLCMSQKSYISLSSQTTPCSSIKQYMWMDGYLHFALRDERFMICVFL
jgi:hypothetical protein